jgi:hypothetical protein
MVKLVNGDANLSVTGSENAEKGFDQNVDHFVATGQLLQNGQRISEKNVDQIYHKDRIDHIDHCLTTSEKIIHCAIN